MSILDKLFRKKNNNYVNAVSSEMQQLLNLEYELSSLLNTNSYIAKSAYIDIVVDNKEVIDFFGMLKTNSLLKEFCKKNDVSQDKIESILSLYDSVESAVEKHNEHFIQTKLVEEKRYLDNILKEVDPVISLDEDQRRVVLTDEDYCLVIAGAGAGKTTTVAAKVRYLVEKQNVDPKKILVVSFTNKAVGELREKINDNLKIDCPIATFHSTGNAILRKENPERLNIFDSTKLYYVVQDYLRSTVLENESTVNNLILFFASYFDAPYEGDNINEFFNKLAKSNFSTMRSDLEEFKQNIIDTRSKKSVTIQSEVLRSNEEVEIANFLYLNNIDYEYEPTYQYNILYSRKPYTPDFIIRQGNKTAYIEHFGITQDGRNSLYTKEELARYKKAINDKIKLHKQHGTTLIYTFSQYNDGKKMLYHLQEQLEENGFELQRRSNKEVMEKIIATEENRYIRKLVNLIVRFITNFKTNGYTVDEFNRMYHSTQNVRTRLFLNICNDCYLEYERYLKANNAVDFQDMINHSARVLKEVKDLGKKLDFKYVIVDEYQDISRQRFDLVSALSEVTDAKIIAVGDDWQSIYAFSGSDITLFTKFAEKMGYAKLLKIVKTYRNSQEVIDIAGNFIQKNESQISKELVSPKNISDPVIIYTYDSTRKDRNGDNRSGQNYAIAHSIEVALEQIIEFSKTERKGKVGTILLLGRFGFDGDRLERSGLFEYITRGSKIKSVKYPKLDITFMTAHASKGLGYDNVIVVNGRNETYGFPSKIEDDPVLAFVVKQDKSIDYAEERRLFYVAMTRTKNRVYFIAPEQNPSEFLLEIKRDYKNVVLKGDWNEEPKQSIYEKKKCPICGYPMQFRYKNSYGLRLYICTNEPEICGFMTNEYKAGKLSILKCDQCQDGYLIVKPQRYNYFLGCTNYRKDGTGCNNVVWAKQYYQMFDLEYNESDFIKSSNAQPTQTNANKKEPSRQIEKNPPKKPKKQERTIIKNKELPEYVYNGYSINAIVLYILQTLSDISSNKYYGTGILIGVLRGSENQKILRSRLDKVEYYGKLKGVPRDDLEVIIECLINNNYILKTKGTYPVLHPTYIGIHYGEEANKGILIKIQNALKKTEQ